MYHVSAQGVDERMINVHYYYYYYDKDTYLPWLGVILLDQCTTTKHNRLLNLSMTNMSMTSTS